MVNLGPTVAVVTGAASGIGLATIERAGEIGYLPVGLDVAEARPDDGPASRAGGRIIRVDVSDASAVRSAIEDVERTTGPIGVAVAAAGVLEERPFHAIDQAQRARTLGVHLGGSNNLTVAVPPDMADFLANDKEGHLRGQVIRISSGVTN